MPRRVRRVLGTVLDQVDLGEGAAVEGDVVKLVGGLDEGEGLDDLKDAGEDGLLRRARRA